MESREHQEFRSRQSVSVGGIVAAALTAGMVNFFMSGGGPWSSAGAFNAVMGRDVTWGFFTLASLHFLLAFIYTTVIAMAIYRLGIIPGLIVGVGVGLLLYEINFVIFRGMGGHMQSPETRAFMTHVIFSLFASAVYKGASVPRPWREPDDGALSQRRPKTV